MALAGFGRDTDGSPTTRLIGSTLSAVTHSSGAMILSGNGSALVGLLTQTGTTIGAALATPAVLAGAAASVVVIGGAVYLCSDED